MCDACQHLRDLGVPASSQLRLHLMLKAEKDGQLPPIHSQDDWNQALSKVPRPYLMKAYKEALLEMPLPENWRWDDLEKLLKEVAPEDGYLSWMRWAQHANIREPGLSKTVEPDAESIFYNQILQTIDVLTDKIQQLVTSAPDWLPLLQTPGQATKVAVSMTTRDRIAAEVKKTFDKMMRPGSGPLGRDEPGSLVDLVDKALDEAGWEGVEALARLRRYIG